MSSISQRLEDFCATMTSPTKVAPAPVFKGGTMPRIGLLVTLGLAIFPSLSPAQVVTGGTIAIAEMVPNHERTGPPHALIFAVNMIINTEEGNTYSFEEMSEWLRAIGFTNVRQLEAPAPSPLILADKP